MSTEEVAEHTRSRLREQKLRQQVRENSPEIRQLKSKLKMAEVNKTLTGQFLERDAGKIGKAEQAKIENEEVEMGKKILMEEIEQERIDKYQQKVKYNDSLNEQLMSHKMAAEETKKHKLEERQVTEEVMKRMQEEDQLMVKAKKDEQKKWHSEIENFKAKQAEMKEKDAEKLKEEGKKFCQNSLTLSQNKDYMEKVKQRQQALSSVQQKLADQMEEDCKNRLAQEQAKLEAYKQELEAAASRKEKEDFEKILKMRGELQDAYKLSMATKEQMQKNEKDIDQKFHNMVLEDLAQKDLADQERAIKRKSAQKERQEYIQKMIEDKQHEKTSEREREIRERQEQVEIEKKRLSLIHEERLKMIQKAGELADFLPKGALKSQEDVEALKEGVK